MKKFSMYGYYFLFKVMIKLKLRPLVNKVFSMCSRHFSKCPTLGN